MQINTQGYIRVFYPADPKSLQTGYCHLRDQDGVPQFCTCSALQGDRLVEGVEDLIVQHLTSVNDTVELQQHKKHT
jgi:hypothetical protein